MLCRVTAHLDVVTSLLQQQQQRTFTNERSNPFASCLCPPSVASWSTFVLILQAIDLGRIRFGSAALHELGAQDAAYCYIWISVVCLFVCLLVTFVNPATTAEPFGELIRVGSRNRVLNGGSRPPREGAILGVVRPIEKHRES